MRIRLTVVIAVVALIAVACNSDDAELTTGSTIITGATNAPAPTTTTTLSDTVATAGTGNTLVGQNVASFEVVARFPNDNGEERYYVIPNGAYTDVDLEDFVIDLLDADPVLYGAKVFDDVDAAEAIQVDQADRTDDQQALIDRHYFVELVGRDRIEYHGPFAEFSGGAIGS